MKLVVIINMLVVIQLADTAKILLYDYKFQCSHVQFMNTIADILVDEGHEVVMLSNVMDATLRDFGSTRVRRYFIEQSSDAAKMRYSSMGSNNWKARGFYDWLRYFGMSRMITAMGGQCVAMLNDVNLIDQLKEEKFDVTLTTPHDNCIFYLFHKANISNYAVIDSHSTIHRPTRFTGVPDQYSTLPGRFASFSEMTFSNRLKNFLTDVSLKVLPKFVVGDYWKRVESTFESGTAPDFHDLVANTSMVFINRIPAIEFPSLTTHTTVDIGGITIAKTNKSLDEHWNSILFLRPRTVLISFGTIALSSEMPENYKQSFLQAIRALPEITFVWKYEAKSGRTLERFKVVAQKPEHRISQGVDNLVEATFIPQQQLLKDPRLSLFITHCGLSSTLETIMAGVPVIAIPTSTDQHRNAQLLKRGGSGIVMDKKDLESSEALERNIREILGNDSYRSSARRIASIIEHSPYTGSENFLRNLNFLIKFGPLPSMRIPSHKQTFIEHHMIDVYALITVVILAIAYCIFAVVRATVRLCSFGVRKLKRE